MEGGSLTEFEENVSFDWDDPDFEHSKPAKDQLRGHFYQQMNIINTESTSQFYQMSTSIQSSNGTLSRHGSNISLSGVSVCLSDDGQSNISHPQYQETMLTIEQIRAYYNTCFTCGVSWSEQHISLDCRECGGYSLERPCPLCDGRCHELWQRDYTTSHSKHQARWIGKCGLSCGPSVEENLTPALEKLRATS